MVIVRRDAVIAAIWLGIAFLSGCSEADRDVIQLAEATVPLPAGDAASGVVAVVAIEPWPANRANKTTGSIRFVPTSTGLELTGRLTNLPKGIHGLHIHQNSSCADPGPHFSPVAHRHGDPQGAEHHLGDLGNIEADAADEAMVSVNVDGLALNGKRSILGHAMVVHADEDDLKTQPSGNSGDVIACGIIEADGDAEVRPENLSLPPGSSTEASG
jgi:superoxide dismutase, Cu-Zn family